MQESRVPPYVAEMPLAGFKTAELFLLTTVRLWFAAHTRNPAPDWRQGLAAAGLLDDGAADLDMALRMLSAAKPALSCREAGHPRLCADEARLLGLFGALQRGETGEVVEDLQRWFPAKPLRWLLRYAGNFARMMAGQTLVLPNRTGMRPQFALQVSTGALLDRGSMLLH